jgi:hypothetical protein
MSFKVDKVKWRACATDIKKVREKVFVYEYHIPATNEFDSNDVNCEHVLIRDDEDNPIATGRLCSDGKISRIAVLLGHRNSDASKRVITKLLDIAREKGMKRVYIDSDLDDVDKYRAQGFSAVGSVYMDSGIAKQPLACPVDNFHCLDNILH